LIDLKCFLVFSNYKLNISTEQNLGCYNQKQKLIPQQLNRNCIMNNISYWNHKSKTNSLNFKVFFLLLFCSFGIHAEQDPCSGKDMLLSLINRPSFSDSACTVPPKKILIEGGLQNQEVIGGGSQVNAPELSMRLGLSSNTEFVINASNYIHQTIVPSSGETPTWMGLKYKIYSTNNWIVSAGGLFSPPSGNKTFGSPNSEAIVDAIIYNKINNKLSWQLQIAVSTLSDPVIQGGQQFQSLNPDFLISYTFEKINAYLEFFGQTKTSSNESFGLSGGFGLIYLFHSNTTFDIEFYQNITGQLQGFEHFIGIGITHLF
jgi:hypothetical protein